MQETSFSILRYSYDGRSDLKELLESESFLNFVECMFNDLLHFYDLTNGLDGVVTADQLNTALAFSSSVRHELTLYYEVLKDLEQQDTYAFDDFKDEKEVEIRKRENRSDIAGTKWLGQQEIAKYAKIENFDEYKVLRDRKHESYNKTRFALRLLENLKIRVEELKTISSNARTEMNNLNIDKYAMSLEEQALDDIKTKRLLLESKNKRAEKQRKPRG